MARLLFRLAGSTLLLPVSVWGQAPQFSTPDSTLATYIAALRSGDARAAAACFHPLERFYLPGPTAIDSITIEKRASYTKVEVAAWKARPPAAIGDVDLQVLHWEGGTSQRFSYLFRRFTDGWRIIAHAGWSDDP